MKFLTRLKLLGNKTLETVLPVDNITQIEELLKKQEKVLSDTKQKYYNSKGKEDYYKNEIERNKKLLKGTIDSAKQAKENKNDEKLRKLFEVKEITEQKIQMYEDCLEKQKDITIKLNQFVCNLDNKVVKAKCNLELLKAKDDFVESMEDFKTVQSGKDDINIDDLTKDIDISFNAKNYEFNDFDVEEISSGDFEDFVKGL